VAVAAFFLPLAMMTGDVVVKAVVVDTEKSNSRANRDDDREKGMVCQINILQKIGMAVDKMLFNEWDARMFRRRNFLFLLSRAIKHNFPERNVLAKTSDVLLKETCWK